MTQPLDGLSSVRGDHTAPLEKADVYAAFERVCTDHPGRCAVVSRHQRIELTYRELHAQAQRGAGGLSSLGLVSGDRLAVVSALRVEWIVLQFAAARLGLVLVPINCQLTPQEIEFALTAAECVALVIERHDNKPDVAAELSERLGFDVSGHSGIKRAAPSRLSHLITLNVITEDRAPATSPNGSDVLTWEDLLKRGDRAENAPPTASPNGDDVAAILFTSGTTGSPKGVALTHRGIVNNARLVGRRMGLCPGDRICSAMPLHHCGGLVLGNLLGVLSASAVVWPSARFSPKAMLDAAEAESCNVIFVVPTMAVALLSDPSFAWRDLSSVRLICMGGAYCSPQLGGDLLDKFGSSALSIVYGMTETSPVSFQTGLGASREESLTSVGVIQDHLEARIVDQDGAVTNVGVAGELWVRGYSVMDGYWNAPDASSEAVTSDGWMKTGDIAALSADGTCRIEGRKKDVIIRGGENIASAEIEDALRAHADIADAAVFGLPDDYYGEIVAAWVIVKEGCAFSSGALQTHCAERLAAFKAPAIIEQVEAFPTTASGKVQKAKIQDVFAARLVSE